MAQSFNPAVTPWFAEASPGLLTNKTVREHLNQYTQQQWPEVVKLTLLHGIVSLQKQYPGRTLSVAQLKHVVEKGAAAVTVEHNIPVLQRQILTLQQQLDGVFDGLAWTPPPAAAAGTQQVQPPAATRPFQEAPRASAPQGLSPPRQQRSAPAMPAASGAAPRSLSPVRASSAWRAGEPSGFTSPAKSRGHSPSRRAEDNQGATNPIYPDWWGDPRPTVPAPAAAQAPPRPQPRLAYSMPQGQQQLHVHQDDLVTPEYLVVESSGYGQSHPALQPYEPNDPFAPGPCGTAVTPAGVHTPQLLQARAGAPAAAAHAQQQGSPPKRCLQAHRRRLAQAQSKIRQQVLESRQRAAQRQERRSHLMEAAVARGPPQTRAGPQQQQQQPGESAGVHGAGRAAQIAEQFMSNSWAAYFMPPVDPTPLPQACGVGSSAANQQPEVATGKPQQRRSAFQDITAETANVDSDSSDADAVSNRGSKASSSKASSYGAGPSRLSAKRHDEDAVRGGMPKQLHEQEASRLEHAGEVQQPPGQAEGVRWSKAWAGDFGHLDTVKLALMEATAPDIPREETSALRAQHGYAPQGVREEVLRSSRQWVGDYGHLTGPRFSADTAFAAAREAEQQQQQQEEQEQQGALGAGISGSTPHMGGSLFMSPAELRALARASEAVAPSGTGSAGAEGNEDPLVALLQRLERQQQEAESEAAQRLAEIESDIAAAMAGHSSDSEGSGSEGGSGSDVAGAAGADAGLAAGDSPHSSTHGAQRQDEMSQDARFLRDLAQRLQAEGSSGSSSVVTAVSDQGEDAEEGVGLKSMASSEP